MVPLENNQLKHSLHLTAVFPTQSASPSLHHEIINGSRMWQTHTTIRKCVLCRSSDDWITHMYNFYHRMEKSSIEVIHHIHARRYELATGDARLAAMNWELHSGAKWIDAWSKDHFGIVLPHDEYEVKCC